MKATDISGLSQLPNLTTPKEQGSMLEGNPSKTGLCEDKNHQDTPTLHNVACSVVTRLVQVEPFLLGACSLPQKALATKADCKFNNAQVDERKHVSTVQPAAPHRSCSLPTSLYSWLLEDQEIPEKGGTWTSEGRTFFPGVTTALFMERRHQAGVKGYLFSECVACSNKAHTKSLWSVLSRL